MSERRPAAVRLARENRRWGRLRIVGECRKLGVTVSATSVRSILRSRRLGRAPRRDGPSWAEFLWVLYLVTGIADVRSSPRRTPDVIATEVSWLPEVPLGLGLEDAIAS